VPWLCCQTCAISSGKETGQSVTHYIFPRGPYATAYAKLKAKGFSLRWQSAPIGVAAARAGHMGNRALRSSLGA
jgi:hypothetical protein